MAAHPRPVVSGLRLMKRHLLPLAVIGLVSVAAYVVWHFWGAGGRHGWSVFLTADLAFVAYWLFALNRQASGFSNRLFKWIGWASRMHVGEQV